MKSNAMIDLLSYEKLNYFSSLERLFWIEYAPWMDHLIPAYHQLSKSKDNISDF